MEPEPWLRGILAGIDPVRGHLLRASEQIREDIRRAVGSLSVEQLWAKPCGITPAGFHAKHLAGSTERLCTYAEGGALSPEQIAAMERESEGGEYADELVARVDAAFGHYDAIVRSLRPDDFGAIRHVGRKKLPVTLIGLLIHIAEHGARHAGQAISAEKASQSPQPRAGSRL